MAKHTPYKRTFKGQGLLATSLKRNYGANWHYGDCAVESAAFFLHTLGRGAGTIRTVLSHLDEAAARYTRDRMPQHARACRIARAELVAKFKDQLYDPDKPMCQDDYEFFSGTGDYA